RWASPAQEHSMNAVTSRIINVVVFFGLMATAFIWARATQSSTVGTGGQYGFRLDEIAHQAGIDFVHQAPTFDAKVAHIMPEIASMGAAVSIVDYDRDGWSDIYVVNSGEGSKTALYRNLHDGTFKDVAAGLGIADVNQRGTGV